MKKTKQQTEHRDLYERVTGQIIAAIETGVCAWRMPWHIIEAAAFCPVNAESRRSYRGVNVLSLWVAAEANQYPSGFWATYRQWQALGAQVRKGGKSTLVVLWKAKDESHDSETETEGEQEQPGPRRGRRLLARGYSVFNAAQVDGWTPPALPVRSKAERLENAERFFSALRADLRFGGAQAFYHRAGDYIQIPRFEAFREPGAYYVTLAHEATHWTGHPSRLARDLSGRFGSNAYAAEELIAELGAAFLCAQLGIASEPRPDHAAYLESWLRVLKQDTRALFTAASKAQAAADWMNARQEA
jgi:antirestriction protein ArdC